MAAIELVCVQPFANPKGGCVMKRGFALFALGAVLLLVPSMASAALCLSVCNQYAPCNRVCQMYGGGPSTTCGAWGDCQGPCQPNFQAVSGTALGAFQVNYFSPNRCDHVVVQQTTWHDTNNCPGSTDYTTCGYYVNASRNDHLCCSFYACFGATSC
jgi:hypothetical protein